MNSPQHPQTHENGFVLVTVLVMLLLIFFIGMSAINTTTVELQIAGNDKVAKQAFYQAEGGLDFASELLEQNISCPQGFGTAFATLGNNPAQLITVKNLAFWQQTKSQLDLRLGVPPATVRDFSNPDNKRDFFYPNNYTGEEPHSNFFVGGDTVAGEGGSLQMAAGYEGVGKGVTGGGASLLYNVFSQHLGQSNSQSLLLIQWRHLIGQEEDCRYAP